MKTLARAEDKAEILRRLRTLRAENRRHWGRMTAHQMVCHLADSFRMVLGEKPASDASNIVHRTLTKWIALSVPLPWMHGIRTRPEVDQECGGTRPVDFAADLAQLEVLFERATAEAATRAAPPHPLFGRLTEREWLRWAYVHMDHHFRQFGA